MAKKLAVDELLRLACIFAEQDRETFIEAYEKMPNDPARLEAEDVLKQIRAYRKKRWGKPVRAPRRKKRKINRA